MANLHSQLDSHVIHGGYLYKKGVYNRAWKKRYFVLFDDRTISYFEKEKHSKHRNKAKGSIHLTQISRVELVHYLDPNHLKQKSKTAFNEIVTNNSHHINPHNKYALRQNSIKQNNYILHSQKSEPKTDIPTQSAYAMFDTTPSFTTDDIPLSAVPNMDLWTDNSDETKQNKFKKIKNRCVAQESKETHFEPLKALSKHRMSKDDSDIPLRIDESLQTRERFHSDRTDIFSPTAQYCKKPSEPIKKTKHIRPQSVTMNGWAFFEHKQMHSTPINSTQWPMYANKLNISQSQSSSTDEENEQNNTAFFGKHYQSHLRYRRRSSSIVDLPLRPLSAKTSQNRLNARAHKQHKRPQSATFSGKLNTKMFPKSINIATDMNPIPQTTMDESIRTPDTIQRNLSPTIDENNIFSDTDSELNMSPIPPTMTDKRRASNLPRPPPRNTIIKAKTQIVGLLPLSDDESDDADIGRFTTVNHTMAKSVPYLHELDIKKYYRTNKIKRRNPDIIVSDNIRKFNRDKREENNEELSHSIITPGNDEHSLYTNVIANTKSDLSADRRYSFALIQPNRNWILSAERESECKKWVAVFNKLVQGKHAWKGYLIKRGKNIKSWKKRYFVLFENKVLNYYHSSNINDKGALVGDIDLRHAMWLRILLNMDEFGTRPNVSEHFGHKIGNKRRSVSILTRKKNKNTSNFKVKSLPKTRLNLRHNHSFTKHDTKDGGNECYLFEIATPNRTWVFCAENEKKRDLWYAQIRDVFFDKLILKIYFDSPCHIEIIHMGQNLKNRYAALLKGWLIIFRDKKRLNEIRQMTFFSDTIFRDYVRNKNCICIPLKDAIIIQNFKSVYGQYSFEIKIQDRCWYFNVNNSDILAKWLSLLRQSNGDIDYSKVEQSYSNLPSPAAVNESGQIPQRYWVESDIKEEDSESESESESSKQKQTSPISIPNSEKRVSKVINNGLMKPNASGNENIGYKLSWNSNEGNEDQQSMDFQHTLDTTMEEITTPIDENEDSIDFIMIN